MKIKLYHGFNDYSYYNIIIDKKNNKTLLNKVKEKILNDDFRLYFNDTTGDYWTFDRVIIDKDKNYNLIFEKLENDNIYFKLKEVLSNEKIS